MKKPIIFVWGLAAVLLSATLVLHSCSTKSIPQPTPPLPAITMTGANSFGGPPPENHSFKGKDYNKNSRIKVRLVRVDLPDGEAEVLITTLLDSQKYPAKVFKELYFLRWGVETFYDELKNKLKVEHFTGYSQGSIRQDFFCAIFISNLQSVIVNDLTEELSSQNQDKKYDYKINTNLSYGF